MRRRVITLTSTLLVGGALAVGTVAGPAAATTASKDPGSQTAGLFGGTLIDGPLLRDGLLDVTVIGNNQQQG